MQYRILYLLLAIQALHVANLLCIIFTCYAGVAQLFRARPCQGRGPGLESLYPHQMLELKSRKALFCPGLL